MEVPKTSDNAEKEISKRLRRPVLLPQMVSKGKNNVHLQSHHSVRVGQGWKFSLKKITNGSALLNWRRFIHLLQSTTLEPYKGSYFDRCWYFFNTLLLFVTTSSSLHHPSPSSPRKTNDGMNCLL